MRERDIDIYIYREREIDRERKNKGLALINKDKVYRILGHKKAYNFYNF